MLSRSDEYSCTRVSDIFQVFLHQFVLAKLATNSIKANWTVAANLGLVKLGLDMIGNILNQLCNHKNTKTNTLNEPPPNFFARYAKYVYYKRVRILYFAVGGSIWMRRCSFDR